MSVKRVKVVVPSSSLIVTTGSGVETGEHHDRLGSSVGASDSAVKVGDGDDKMSRSRRLLLLTDLPAALASLAMSYNRCADYVAVWRTGRRVWPVLRRPDASPADCRVQNPAQFLERVDPRPLSLPVPPLTLPLLLPPSSSSSPPPQTVVTHSVDADRKRSEAPKNGSVAAYLRPRCLRVSDHCDIEHVARLRQSALAPFIHTLTFAFARDVFASALTGFANLRHVHGAATLTPERKRSAPWSASDWLGPYDVFVAPPRLECYQTSANVRIYGLAPFADCHATLTSLGCVSLYTQAHVDQLQRFSALRTLRCTLTTRPDSDAVFLSGDSLFYGVADRDATLGDASPSMSAVARFPPPLAKLDIAVETDAFRVQQLAALAPTLRSLRLKRHTSLGDMRGLVHLTQLTELVLDSNGVAPHQYALPPSVTSLVALGHPSALFAHVDPKSLTHVTHVRLVQSFRVVVSDLPVALCHMTTLKNLSITYPRTDDHKSTTRSAPIRVAELAALPRTIRVFDYAGPPCADFSPLREWPELHTLVYRLPLYANVESSHTYAYAREPGVLPNNCVWPTMRALRSLTAWHYWNDAPELFPALREFYFLSRSPLAMTHRAQAMRRFAHLERFEPDAKPSDYMQVHHEPERVCDAFCCCCSRSAL